MFALVPGALVVALGARRRELGLTRPAKGTFIATLAVIGLFLMSWAWRMAHGHPSIPMLGLFLAHNLLSNGFSEEFQTKGLVFHRSRFDERSLNQVWSGHPFIQGVTSHACEKVPRRTLG
jgi:hypothetical protein